MAYIGNQPTSVAFVTDQFSGNGSTTAFTMSVAPANTASVLVAVSGVLQDPSTYSVSGTTLTFSAAPPTGTGNISARYLGIPASGVTTTAYRTVTEFTATAGQTTFTPPSYTVGYINVYRNGVRLGSSDFTATNGTTVVLAVGATVGDLVTTESFYVSSVLNAIPNTPASVGSSNIVAGAVGSTQIATGAVSLTTQVSGTLPIANGGTGLTSAGSSGQVLTSTGSAFSLGSAIVSGTSQASTSGTSITFTGIPSWVKRITVMFNAVSTTGTSDLTVQLGTSGGFITSGYRGSAQRGTGTNLDSNGFNVTAGIAASTLMNGSITLCILDSANNIWAESGVLGHSDGAAVAQSGGSVTLTGTLTQVRVTTIGGTDTFDAGSINILYE